MGHVHLVVLPKSLKWAAVADALTGGGTDAAVAALSASAAERDLLVAARDETFVEAVRLSFLVPRAARAADLGDALRQIGLTVGNTPDQFAVIVALTRRLDEVARGSKLRTDLGQLAGRSLVGVLNDHINARLPGLFDPTPADV